MNPSASSLEQSILARCADRDEFFRHRQAVLAKAARTGAASLFDPVLIQALRDIPEPEAALRKLARFLDASFNPSGVIRDFIETPEVLETFFRLTAISGFIHEVLIRDPQLFRWLSTQGTLDQRMDVAAYHDNAAALLQPIISSPHRLDALRSFQRRELLRIAAADLLGIIDVEEATASLSALADAIVMLLLVEATRRIEERIGLQPPLTFCVIALGKWGGGELNYSSDIDFMVLYKPTGGAAGEHAVFNLAVKTVEELLSLLSGVSLEGFFYRTDIRLRPDGAAGPATMTVPAALQYYDTRGTLWERQMLLKARISAGDAALGKEFLDRIESFMFPLGRPFDAETVLADVQRRVDERRAPESDVKHGRGGIRFIEFGIQSLMLIHGAEHPGVRASGTLDALRRLADHGLIAPDDEILLRDVYRFLRKVEHLLQLEQFEQTHSLPPFGRDFDLLAWKMGYSSPQEFAMELHSRRETATRWFDRVVRRADGGIVSEQRRDEEMNTLLRSLGFTHAEQSAKTLDALVAGSPEDGDNRERQDALRARLYELLPSLAREPLPDIILSGWTFLRQTGHSPEKILRFLSSPDVATRFIKLSGMASAHLRAASQNPDGFEEALGGEPDSASHVWDSLESFKTVRETAALADHFSGKTSFENFVGAITAVADNCVQELFRQRFGESSIRFLVIAMGKYGGQELIPYSDLDIVLLHEDLPASRQEEADALGLEFVRVVESSAGYRIDTRLRPEGRSGLPTLSMRMYAEYIANRASRWEKQALMKARVATGHAELDGRYRETIAGLFGKYRLAYKDIEELQALRLKSEPVNRFRTKDFFDIKLSSGGLMDAEYATQAVQLSQVSLLPAVRVAGTLAALKRLPELLPGFAFPLNRMRGNYLFLRRLQVFLRVALDIRSNLLPSGAEQRFQLARLMGLENGERLLEKIGRLRKEMREDYAKILQRL